MRTKKEVTEKLYFETHGEEILRSHGFTKSAFAEAMGIQKQNVNVLFSIKNILILKQAAAVLDIPIGNLIAGEEEIVPISVNGFVQVEQMIYRVDDKESLQNVLNKIEQLEQEQAEKRAAQCLIEY